ncbi:MAG: alpha-E domain-containing protein [Gammaproteobacteria bacterium]
MLARAAERVYWTGRYLERAENTARIVQQYSQLLLDLPEEVGVGWSELVTIFGAAGIFPADADMNDEKRVLRFLVSDAGSPSSLAHAIRMARDNIRNTRDLLPQESWECVNELDHFARRRLPDTADDEDRFELLSECIARCLQINGILVGTMSHGAPYQFLRLGQSIERADMTSRIVDVATAYIRKDPDLVARFGSVLWTNVLKSVSGFQMYRQYCEPRVDGTRVIEFLLSDMQFPRAIACCISRARFSCAQLPHGDPPRAALDRVAAMLEEASAEELPAADVSALMDRIQAQLGEAHAAIARSWFLWDGNQ